MESDLISRQAAIDAINTWDKFGVDERSRIVRWHEGLEPYVHLRDVLTAIVNLPPAQPTITPKHNDGWVLCSERMPPEHEWIGTRKFGTTMSDEVYVTFEDPEGERFTKHLHFHNGELSRYDKAHMDAWYKDYKPIAWMPLPKPYRGEEKR